MRCHDLINHRSFGVAESRFGRCFPVAWSRMPAQKRSGTRVRLPTADVLFFPGCETLPQVIERNGIEWWPYTHAVLVAFIQKPPAA